MMRLSGTDNPELKSLNREGAKVAKGKKSPNISLKIFLAFFAPLR